MRVRWATPRPRRWRISSWSTAWPKRPQAPRRPRKRPTGRRSGRSATTRSKAGPRRSADDVGMLGRLFNSRNFLGLLFMLPGGVLLLVFLTYPLGLGTWLGFTDAKIGRAGEWIGLDNFQFLVGDTVARLSLFNTLFYTIVASVAKFALGLWLALLLYPQLSFKAFFRAVVLLPLLGPPARRASGAECPLSRFASSRDCRPSRRRSTRRRRWTAPGRGSDFAM